MDNDPTVLSINNQKNEFEMKKRINLYFHPLFQETLNKWLPIFLSEDGSYISYSNYINLNLALQKSLIPDYQMDSATKSAIEVNY